MAKKQPGGSTATLDSNVILKANNAFTTALYGKLAKKQGNLFFSPFSIHCALTMCALGAIGTTRKQLDAVLSNGDEDIAGQYGETLQRLRTPAENKKYESGDPYRFEVANALWPNIKFEPSGDYVRLIRENFDATLQPLDFGNEPDASAAVINRSIEQKTHGKIKNLVPAALLNKETSMVLTNAVWFKGSWGEAFKPESTSDQKFTNRDGSVSNVKLMRQKHEHQYYEDTFMTAVVLPYKGEAKMVVMLAKEDAVLDKLNADAIQSAIQHARNYQVDLHLPKFKVESEFRLGDMLQELGANRAFSNQAEFDLISAVTPTKIGEVIHKAFVEVDEAGTEAAAATAVLMFKCTAAFTPPETRTFRVDQPFAFAIVDPTNTILFAGRVEKL